MYSNSFLVEILWFSICNNMLSAKTDVLLLFKYGYHFISFSYLISVARSSNIMLNRNGKSGHPCLIPDFKGKAFSFSPQSMM